MWRRLWQVLGRELLKRSPLYTWKYLPVLQGISQCSRKLSVPKNRQDLLESSLQRLYADP